VIGFENLTVTISKEAETDLDIWEKIRKRRQGESEAFDDAQ